jgi:uncharacterized protein (DUF362 family)
MARVAQVRFSDYGSSVAEALDAIGAADRLPRDGLIILKPNLTNASPPPVTTPVGMVEAVYEYCREHTRAEVAVGEGCGSGVTTDTYQANGYTEMAARHGTRLLDFNTEEAVRLERDDALQLKELYLPAIAQDAFVISIPILKDHCFTVTTIAMKNMFGLAPAPFYAGSWNKSRLHTPSTHRSVVDICLYKKPDLCVVDAVVALSGMHLSGTPRELGLVLAGWDPVAVDAAGSRLMGHDPARIEYLALADGLIGSIAD